MAAKTYVVEGDYFTYYNPKYPRTKNIKPMKAESVNTTHVEVGTRKYPMEFCTKVEICECTTMHYLHHMNTQDVNNKCTMCNKQRI